MTDVKVRKLLEQRLLDIKDEEGNFIVEFDTSPEGKAIAPKNLRFENTVFERPENGRWLDIAHLALKPYRKELGSRAPARWRGIMQVSIYDLPDSGMEWADTVFQAIHKAFRDGYFADGIRILSVGRSHVQHPATDDWSCLVIDVAWEADIER